MTASAVHNSTGVATSQTATTSAPGDHAKDLAVATSIPSTLRNDSVVNSTSDHDGTQGDNRNASTSPLSPMRRFLHNIWTIVTWTPPACRWDANAPPKFSLGLNLLFGFAGAFTVANLYYSHPILGLLAHDFGVSQVDVSQIPTLAQAGYAVGLLLLCPLGDIVRRRPFVLLLVGSTATICIGMAVTSSLAVFSAIQFLAAVMTVTPQLMLPLVGDLAPPAKRAAALSIVTSGLMLGILIARLLSGIVANYTSWRIIYWISVALQYAILIALWLYMPDYPSTNPGGLNYFRMLASIVVMLTRHPVLVQACLISFFIAATFTNFWTVLTFLLEGPPYYYSTVVIGLFALVGIASLLTGPIYARIVIDRFVPLFSVILGLGWCMLGVCIGTYTGTFTVAGPILQAWFNDFGMQTSQIANRSAIYAVEPKGRNRVNTAFMLFTFCGQLVGTSVGSRLFARGGWIASGSYSVASIGMALLITLTRGPWEEGWLGWRGGWDIRKKKTAQAIEPTPDPLALNSADTAGTADVEKGAMAITSAVAARNDPDMRHIHRHAHDNQAAVNATDHEKNLEMLAAEDTTDVVGDDEDEEKKRTEDENDVHVIAHHAAVPSAKPTI